MIRYIRKLLVHWRWYRHKVYPVKYHEFTLRISYTGRADPKAYALVLCDSIECDDVSKGTLATLETVIM